MSGAHHYMPVRCFDFSAHNHDIADKGMVPFADILNTGQTSFFDPNYTSDTLYAAQKLCSILAVSQHGKAMLDMAARLNFTLGFEYLEDTEYLIEPNGGIVLCTSGCALASLDHQRDIVAGMVLALAKALRDAIISDRLESSLGQYKADALITVERLLAADLDCVTALVAWQLKPTQHSHIWRVLVTDHDGDMALAYANRCDKRLGDRVDQSALETMFLQWFKDEARVEDCDHFTLGFMDECCTKFGRMDLNAALLSYELALPCGHNYLSGLLPVLLGDPRYTADMSEINQAHFLQIMDDLADARGDMPAFRNASLAALFDTKQPALL